MRFLLLIIWIGCFFWQAHALPLHAPLHASTPDSLCTFKQVLKVHLSYPDSALQLLQTMDERQLEPAFLTDAHRALVYQGRNQNRLAADYAQKALEHDSLVNYRTYYLQTLSCATEVNRLLGRYKTCLALLQQGIGFARRVENLTAEANFLFTSGTICRLMGDTDEADRYFSKAIRMAEDAPPPKLMPFLSYFYGQMTSMLIEDGQYDEAWEYCRRREELLHKLATFPRIPMGYLDQQYAYLYSKQAGLLLKLGRNREAAACYREFMNTQLAQRPEGCELLVPYWLESGQYARVVDCLLHVPLGADTLNAGYAHRLKTLAEAYHGLKKHDRAYQYQYRLTRLTDSLHRRRQETELAELATVYQLKEKEYEIRQQDEVMERMALVRNGLLGAFVLLCGLLGLTVHHLRTVQWKNRLLARTFDDALQYEQQVVLLEKEITEAQEKGDLPEPADADNASVQFKRIVQLIKEEKLYLNPDLNRQEILDRLSIDKNQFARLMQENLQMSFPQYISQLRIKASIELLKENPNYTMQAIAEESGFSNVRNFQRLFKGFTGMTPTEYKEALRNNP